MLSPWISILISSRLQSLAAALSPGSLFPALRALAVYLATPGHTRALRNYHPAGQLCSQLPRFWGRVLSMCPDTPRQNFLSLLKENGAQVPTEHKRTSALGGRLKCMFFY